VSAKYLLPCRCGQTVVIEPRQAGQTAVCSCGQSLTIPAMLEITALEPVPVEPQTTQQGGAWGWQQQLMLLGIVMLAFATGIGVWKYVTRPKAAIDMIDPERIRQAAKDFPPAQTWHYWRAMKQGLDLRVDLRYENDMTLFRVWQTFAAVLALGGLALVATGIAIGRAAATQTGDAKLESKG
jgi:hypothetical protein